MTLQHHLLDHGVVIDDGKIRVVVDVSDKQVRLFSHYINDKGNEKLRTERVLEFDAFLNMLYAMYLQGTPK
jgi:hypothetical protein